MKYRDNIMTHLKPTLLPHFYNGTYTLLLPTSKLQTYQVHALYYNDIIYNIIYIFLYLLHLCLTKITTCLKSFIISC